MNRRLLLAAFGSLLLCSPPVWAVNSYPMVMGIKPVAIQTGTSAELAVQARYSMSGTYQVLVSGTGVTGGIVDSRSTPAVTPKRKRATPAKARRGPSLELLNVRFHADKDALPGIRDIRLAGPYGASTVGQLLVVEDPVISEKKDNDTPEKAQRITLPAAVCGTIESIEDRDYFKFHVEAGQSLVFRVRGMLLEDRIHDLQNHLDPIITLRGPTGATLAVADNDISGDPLLCQRFDRAGDYTLEIRDVRYKGDRDWVYCVEISDRPFVRTVYPLAFPAGKHVSLEPIGWQLPKAAKITWEVPANWSAGFHDAQLPLENRLTNVVPLVVTDLPTVLEQTAGHDTAPTAQLVSTPLGINGRIQKEGEVDVYAFRAEEGRNLHVRGRLAPRRVASRLSPATARCQGAHADGSRRPVGVRPVVGRRRDRELAGPGRRHLRRRDPRPVACGGPTFVYFLKITHPEPEFLLALDTDKTELTPGTSGVFFVNSLRKNGFTGEIALHVEGLPEGVAAFCDRIPPNHRDGCIILTASTDAKPAVKNIVVTGTATLASPKGSCGGTLHAVARPLQETYVPGGGRGHLPVEAHAVAVGVPSDILAVKLSRQELSLAPGGSACVDVVVDLLTGFRRQHHAQPGSTTWAASMAIRFPQGSRSTASTARPC